MEQVIPLSKEQFWLRSTIVVVTWYKPICTEFGGDVSQIAIGNRSFPDHVRPDMDRDQGILWSWSKAPVSHQHHVRLQLECQFSSSAEPLTFSEFLHSDNTRGCRHKLNEQQCWQKSNEQRCSQERVLQFWSKWQAISLMDTITNTPR